jgi:hypothetical protein
MEHKRMNECVIACETLRDELQFVMAKTNTKMPAFWIESGLHNVPNKLHTRLQEALDRSAGYQRVYFLFGTCGNSVLGLKTGGFELIMPRVDDCISLLIGHREKREEIARAHAAYFLTEGWLRGERNMWVEYQYSVKKFGKAQAEEIIKLMYGHYRTLGLLDTQVNPVDRLVDATKTIAETFNLTQQVIPATTAYIDELLRGPWPASRFIVKAPYSEIQPSDILLDALIPVTT